MSLSDNGEILALGAAFRDRDGNDAPEGMTRVMSEFISIEMTGINSVDIHGTFKHEEFGHSVELSSNG